MLYDLGFDPAKLHNTSAVREKVAELDEQLDLVMLAEK